MYKRFAKACKCKGIDTPVAEYESTYYGWKIKVDVKCKKCGTPYKELIGKGDVDGKKVSMKSGKKKKEKEVTEDVESKDIVWEYGSDGVPFDPAKVEQGKAPTIDTPEKTVFDVEWKSDDSGNTSNEAEADKEEPKKDYRMNPGDELDSSIEHIDINKKSSKYGF